MREIDVCQPPYVHYLQRDELRQKVVEGDVPPAEIVSTHHLNGWPDIVDTLWLFVKVFKQAGILKAKVRSRKLNLSELRHDLQRVLGCRDRGKQINQLLNVCKLMFRFNFWCVCLTQEIVSYYFGVGFDDVHGDWIAELAKVAQNVSTVVLDGPLHHLRNQRVKY